MIAAGISIVHLRGETERDFVLANKIEEGDDLPYAANHIVKYIPVKEE